MVSKSLTSGWSRLDTAHASVVTTVPGHSSADEQAAEFAMAVMMSPIEAEAIGAGCCIAQSATEIVFVDAAVNDIDTILANIDPSFQVHVVDADVDGVEYMASVLEGMSDVSAVHIISHGAEGQFQLGSATWLITEQYRVDLCRYSVRYLGRTCRKCRPVDLWL
jgi:hypothetical protein